MFYNVYHPKREKPVTNAFMEFPLLQTKLTAVFLALTEEQQEKVLRSIGYKKVRTFLDEQSGVTIKLHLYYGFSDAGGIVGGSYATREDAVDEITSENKEMGEVGTEPEDLGDSWCTVLSGREFVDRLKEIEPHMASVYESQVK